MFFLWRQRQTIDGLFQDDLLPEKKGHELVDYWRELVPQMEHTDELGGFQLLEIRSSLPDEFLMYADKLSMAHSLEVRVPYLDRTVVEYVQGSGDFKVRNGSRKWLHRQVCQSYLPLVILKTKETRFCRERGGRMVSFVAQRRASGNALG